MIFSGLPLVAVLAFAAFFAPMNAVAKPHIILMVLDDIGRADTGIYGPTNIPVPKLTSLAKEGVIFENFYTQTVCSPTRSALLTGRYPFRFGMQHFSVGFERYIPNGFAKLTSFPQTQLPGMKAGVPLDTPMIPALLAKQGYERHAIGKWHCGYATWDHTPMKRGFQSYTGYLQAQGDYYTHKFALKEIFLVGERLDGYDFWHNTRPLTEASGNYSVDIYRSAMRNVLKGYVQRHETPEKQREHPLFIYMAHQTVHIPIQYKKEEERCAHITHYVRRKYCNMMVELDDAIDEMVSQLKTLNLWDNTLILTLTDNGGMVKWAQNKDAWPVTAASQGSNYPLRGSKVTMFDGGVRSTAFAAGGYIPKEARGRRVHELAHVVDFSATILTLGGVIPAKKERLRLDGNNLFELIAKRPGAGPVRDHVPINVVNGGKKYSAVRFGKYKLIVDDFLEPRAQGWFDENGDLKEAAAKYVKGQLQLYDLEKDPYERNNIAEANPRLVKYGQDLIRNYVEGGDYMEPQDDSKVYVKALPVFHGGVWKPFLDPAAWQKAFDEEKARNQRKYTPNADDLVELDEFEKEDDPSGVFGRVPSYVTVA